LAKLADREVPGVFAAVLGLGSCLALPVVLLSSLGFTGESVVSIVLGEFMFIVPIVAVAGFVRGSRRHRSGFADATAQQHTGTVRREIAEASADAVR